MHSEASSTDSMHFHFSFLGYFLLGPSHHALKRPKVSQGEGPHKGALFKKILFIFYFFFYTKEPFTGRCSSNHSTEGPTAGQPQP